jgi:hypothetical protein
VFHLQLVESGCSRVLLLDSLAFCTVHPAPALSNLPFPGIASFTFDIFISLDTKLFISFERPHNFPVRAPHGDFSLRFVSLHLLVLR